MSPPRLDSPSGDKAITRWLAFGERGRSPEAIALAAWNGKAIRTDWPRDPDDLRRCLLLLEAAPSAKTGLDILAGASRQWAALVAVWPALADTFTEEVGGQTGSAPRTYAMMRAALDGAGG